MCRTRSRLRSALLCVTCLVTCGFSATAAGAQSGFEDTDLSNWTTAVSGFLDREVSGASETAGGNPGAHHLVRHHHRLFESFPTSVVSASFSPIELDPGELDLPDSPRFSLDARLEVLSGALVLEPSATWVPILEQSGVVYRQAMPSPSFERDDSWVRGELILQANGWAASDGARPDISAGAAPVRLGVLIQSIVVVAAEQQIEALVRIDNVRVQPDAGVVEVSLVAVPSPAGGHVVFAPPECFDGEPDDVRRVVDVTSEADATWDGCVEASAPGLLPDLTFGTSFCFDPAVASLQRTLQLGCGETAPSFVELLLGSEAPGGLPVRLGTPARARIEPCSVRVAGGDLSCGELTQECPAEVLFGLLCRVESRSEPCYLNPLLGTSRADPRAHTASFDAAREAEDPDPLETLRRLRDEVMSVSVDGRYYRDLYDAFSPELRELVLDDLGIVRDVFAAAPAWLDALGALVDGGGGEAPVTAGMVGGMLDILDRFESRASPALREVFRRERSRLELEDTAGLSIDEARDLLEQRGGPPPCAATDTSLCIQGGRFRVEVTWTDFEGASGSGRAVALSGDSGYFWFFDPDNVELVVKVLDGRTINDRYWVFYGALSNVEYTVLVTDTVTGSLRAYRNPSGIFASVGDTSAFTPDGAPRDGSEVADDDNGAAILSALGSRASETLRRSWGRVRESFRRGPVAVPPSRLAADAAGRALAGSGTCVAGANALCLAGNRFRVEVEWRDFAGLGGAGNAVPLTPDTGTFWFFDAANTELIVKVLDARAINDHFWVYYGALSNVEYTLRVTDTASGRVRTYENPAGSFASRGDVEAF